MCISASGPSDPEATLYPDDMERTRFPRVFWVRSRVVCCEEVKKTVPPDPAGVEMVEWPQFL